MKEASRRGWGGAITQMQGWLISDPKDSADAKWGFMNNVLTGAQHRQLAPKLWLDATAKEPMASDMRRRGPVLSQINPRGASELADMVAGGSAGATIIGRAPNGAARAVGLEDDEVSKEGPMNKMAKIAARAGSLEQIQRSEATAGGTNVTRNCELRLKSVAPGIR